MLDKSFQEAKQIAEDLVAFDPTLQIETRTLIEVEWLDYLAAKKRELGGKAYMHGNQPLCIHSVLGYIGGLDGLLMWAGDKYDYELPAEMASTNHALREKFQELAQNEFDEYMAKQSRKFVYMDFGIPGTVDEQRVVFELFVEKCPKTCENFIALCTGEKGTSEQGTKLHYKNTPIHRVVKNGWIQGGDLINGKGDNSESIWGDIFRDESFSIKHNTPGILSMANSGPHTNGSQFFVTLREFPCFDSKKVAFGRVVCGRAILDLINQVETVNQYPKDPVVIKGCGVLEATSPKAAVTSTAKKPSKKATKKATILVCGLDDAGKSTIVQRYTGEEGNDTVPTNGFERDTLTHDDFDVTMFGLGGGKSIRGYWSDYYDNVSGIVYVIDASDNDRLAETAEYFQGMISHAQVVGKPCVVYVNKQDLPNALSSAEVALGLKIGDRPGCVLYNSVAIQRPDEPNDPNILKGLSWLLAEISKDYDALAERVKKDVAQRKRLEKEKMEELKKKHAK